MKKQALIVEIVVLAVLILAVALLLPSCMANDSSQQSEALTETDSQSGEGDVQEAEASSGEGLEESEAAPEGAEIAEAADSEDSEGSSSNGELQTEEKDSETGMAADSENIGGVTATVTYPEDSAQAVSNGSGSTETKTALERTSDRYMTLMRNLLRNDPAHQGDVLMYLEVVDFNHDLSYEYSVLFREPTELLRQEVYNMNSDKPVISVPVNRYNLYFAADEYDNVVASIETKDGVTYIVNDNDSKLYYAKSKETEKDGYPLLIASEFMDRGRGQLPHAKMEGAVKSIEGVPVELATNQDLSIINSIILGNKKEPAREPIKVDFDADRAESVPDETWKKLFDDSLASYVKAMDENKKLFE